MLLPLLMDIETDGVKVSENESKRMHSFDYVYLDTGKRILKFKVEFKRVMPVVDAMKACIGNIDKQEYFVASEKDLKKLNVVPKQFLEYAGKYKLEDKLFKTDNYLVPPTTRLIGELINMYKSFSYESQCLMNPCALNTFCNIINDQNTTEEEFEIINKLLSKIDVTLVNEFDCNSESLIVTINNIEKMVDGKTCKSTLNRLKWMLNSFESNINYINTLGIEEKFVEAVKSKSATQKVKSL